MKHGFHCQDEVEADLRCLMCSRLIGQLYGLIRRETGGQRSAPSLMHVSEFLPSAPGARSVPVKDRAQLRCLDCGGVGVVDEIVVRRLGDSLDPEDGCPVHRERVRGPGRRPRRCQCGDLRDAA